MRTCRTVTVTPSSSGRLVLETNGPADLVQTGIGVLLHTVGPALSHVRIGTTLLDLDRPAHLALWQVLASTAVLAADHRRDSSPRHSFPTAARSRKNPRAGSVPAGSGCHA